VRLPPSVVYAENGTKSCGLDTGKSVLFLHSLLIVWEGSFEEAFGTLRIIVPG
jgi:hypothetical protein